MYLRYNNYLSAKTDSKFVSRNTLTDLGRVRQNDNRQFEFSLEFEENKIVDQANLFSDYISAIGIFENSFLNNSSRVKLAGQLIRDAYIYSYIKSVFYSYQLISNNVTSLMGPSSNTVFFGHKLMHDIICEGYIQQFSLPNNIISLELNPPTDTIQQLEKFSLWPEIYNSRTGRVFNPELETVLNFFKTKCSMVVATSNIADRTSKEVRNLSQLPIGNLAFSEDMQQLLYVENEAVQSDKISFYWNKANLITAKVVPPIDADDSIYDTILTSNYDPNGITFEVQSITGFSPLTAPRSNYDYSLITGPNFDSPDFNDGLTNSISYSSRGNPNTYSRRNNNNNNNGGNNRNNPKSKFDSNLTSIKNRVEKVTENVVNLIRRTDEIVTPERIILVSDIIYQITGRRPKLKTLKQFAGERLGKVLEENGILLKDRIVGSNEEYDYFYADSNFINGKYNTELVGVQKYITSK
jgi:hypothetical protein